jgi:hypothetical protein
MKAIAIAVAASPEALTEETNNGENILVMPGNGGIPKNKIGIPKNKIS